ncbi:MAG TPA: serine/threonine-protein kinase [Stenomitos sp.]
MSLCINPSCSNTDNRDTQLFCQNCSSELLLEGRYRVTRQLGSGGFGKTYEVSDRSGPIQVLKVLSNNHPKYVELFQREAQVLARLKHHGIPKVEPNAYFVFLPRNRSEPLHCLVMEKIEGLNLEQYIRQRGSPIDHKLARQWLIQLVTILQEVHSQNFFHRDIKPSNIMLRADGHLVLIDFGTAREVTDTYVTKQATGEVTGVISAGYTPPEQFNGQAVPQSDFFALARTFIYLLSGKDPSKLYDSYADELRWRDAAPLAAPQLADLLEHMMARFPHQRPQTAAEILQQLEQISSDTYLPQNSLPKPIPQVYFQQTLPIQPLAEETEELIPYRPLSPSPPQPPLTPPTEIPPVPPPRVHPSHSSIPTTRSSLEPHFIRHCQQELAEYIGPIAAIICQRTLAQNPGMSVNQFVEALAKKIPNSKHSQEFQRRLLT